MGALLGTISYRVSNRKHNLQADAMQIDTGQVLFFLLRKGMQTMKHSGGVF